MALHVLHDEKSVSERPLGDLTGARFRMSVLRWIDAQYHAAIRRHDYGALSSGKARRAISNGVQQAIVDLAAWAASTEAEGLPLPVGGLVLFFPAGLYPIIEVIWDPRVALEGEQTATSLLFFAGVDLNGVPLGAPTPGAQLRVLLRVAPAPGVRHWASTHVPDLVIRELDLAGSAQIAVKTLDGGPQSGFGPTAAHAIRVEVPVQRIVLDRVGIDGTYNDAIRVLFDAPVVDADRIRGDIIGGYLLRMGSLDPLKGGVLWLTRYTVDFGSDAPNFPPRLEPMATLLLEGEAPQLTATQRQELAKRVFGRGIARCRVSGHYGVALVGGRIEVKTTLLPETDPMNTTTPTFGPAAMVCFDQVALFGPVGSEAVATAQVESHTIVEAASASGLQGLCLVRSRTSGARLLGDACRNAGTGKLLSFDDLEADRDIVGHAFGLVDSGLPDRPASVLLDGQQVGYQAPTAAPFGTGYAREGDIVLSRRPKRPDVSLGSRGTRWNVVVKEGFGGGSPLDLILSAYDSLGVTFIRVVIPSGRPLASFPAGRHIGVTWLGLGVPADALVREVDPFSRAIVLRTFAKPPTGQSFRLATLPAPAAAFNGGLG